MVLGVRGLAILFVGFAGNVVVARMLAPGDLGVVAIGMSFVLFTGLISDGGLGAGLIRRPVPPRRPELAALSALQLGVTGVVALAALAVAEPLGRVGWVTAIMVCSMPVVALQFPGRILLERAMRFQRLSLVELSQVVCYYGFAIGTVAAGFGVWGLAVATVVRAGAGAVAMAFVCPAGLVRPVWAPRLIRPLIGFGLRFQAVNATWLLRDQVLNVSVAGISGTSVLGLWTLARRLLEVPYLLFGALWRVSFPAMSQLVAGGDEPAPVVERAERITAAGTAFVLSALTGAAPGLVPGLFGPHWQAASAVIPGACLGLAIGGSVSVATQGYLYAVGDAAAVLRSGVLQAVAWLAVTLGLLQVMGAAAVGLGWAASALVEAVVLARAAARHTRVRLLRPLVAPVGVGAFAATLGWALTVSAGPDIRGAVAGASTAAVVYVIGMAAADRRALADTFRFSADAARAAISRRPRSGPGPRARLAQ